MSRLTRSLGGLALFVLVVGMAAPAVAAERYTIGTLGATIPGETWERRVLTKDFGRDQFLRADRNYFMVVLETFALYEVRADFVEGLDTFVSGIQARTPETTLDPELE